MYNINPPTQIRRDQYFFLGIHPWNIEKYSQLDLTHSIQKNKSHPQFLGIGEIGLDKVKGPNFQSQIKAFEDQLKMIKEFNITRIVLHNVRSFNESFEILKSYDYQGLIILHDFYKNVSILDQFLKLSDKTYISLGPKGIKSKHLKQYPQDRILLETDDNQIKIEQIYQEASQALKIPLNELSLTMKDRFKEILLTN